MPVEKWELRKTFTFNLPWLGQKCSSFEWHKLSHLASPAHNIHRQQLCKAGQDQECLLEEKWNLPLGQVPLQMTAFWQDQLW